MTKLLALAASHRPDSLNMRLLDLAVTQARSAGAHITLLDYQACDAPLYRGETNVASLPEGAELLSEQLRAHDGILLATPEYNWSIPGGLKNLIDWLSVDPRMPLTNKTALLMCASPSSRGGVTGLQHLRTCLEVLKLWVYPQMIAIGRAQQQLQSTHLAIEADQQHLTNCVDDFVRATGVLRHRD